MSGDAELGASRAAFRCCVAGVTDIVAESGSGLCLAAESRCPGDQIDHLAATIYIMTSIVSTAAHLFGARKSSTPPFTARAATWSS